MPDSDNSRIDQDAFTKRLIAVYSALEKAKALRKRKGEFAEDCDVSQSHFAAFVKQTRNYPNDVERRRAVIKILGEKWGVNPAYLLNHSENMFSRPLYESQPMDIKVLSENAVRYETSRSLLDMLQQCQTENQLLRSENQRLGARVAVLEAQ